MYRLTFIKNIICALAAFISFTAWAAWIEGTNPTLADERGFTGLTLAFSVLAVLSLRDFFRWVENG